ncbi:hypothetical protein AB9P05_22325 [Roseivirga sp. BDSF3-8]
MSKKIKPEDNHANQLNPNKGTPGKNEQRQKAEDNKANQKNPNKN